MSEPASEDVRAKVYEDFRKAHGLDLSDEDRAAWVRARHGDGPRIPATCTTRCSACGLYDCGFDYCRCDQP